MKTQAVHVSLGLLPVLFPYVG